MAQEDRTVLLESVKLDEGVSQKTGKAYKRTVISWNGEDGQPKYASAFGDSLFTPAKALEGDKAVVTLEQRGNFLDLVAIHPAAKTAQEKVGTGEYVTGQKPAIEVRRISAAVAWHCASRMAGPELGFDAAQNIANKIFYDLLKKGKAVEDDDIPF